MAHVIGHDSIDWSAYERETEARIKVRSAFLYEDELVEQFADKPKDRSFVPEMFSTKLRNRIEFRPGEVTAWAGYNGHKKSMFTGQVALDLCVQRQRVMVASFEMQPATTLSRMARQAFASSKPSNELLRRFSKWTDGRLWLFDHLGRVSPSQVLAVIRYFAEELGGTQVFIDSMMMVCASEESLDEQKQLATDLVRISQELGVHIHLIAHCRKPQQGEDRPPTKYDLRGSAAISDQCHNVITVWANKAKAAALEKDNLDQVALAEPDALVSVEKQRNGEWEGKVKLWFHPAGMRFCDDRTSPVDPYALQLD